jgi:hypothetical protein
MACQRESAVILRRQRAPPGRCTIGDGFVFHKAAATGTQPFREDAANPILCTLVARVEKIVRLGGKSGLSASPATGIHLR